VSNEIANFSHGADVPGEGTPDVREIVDTDFIGALKNPSIFILYFNNMAKNISLL
jgi:hypothetical protein